MAGYITLCFSEVPRILSEGMMQWDHIGHPDLGYSSTAFTALTQSLTRVH